MANSIERIEPACIIAITGSDRNKWLHNFCSNEIKSLLPGTGCEAFVLNVKGKTLCHAIVLAGETSLTLLALGTPATNLVEHFDRYIIREDVQLADISDSTAVWWAAKRIDVKSENAIPWTHSTLQTGIVCINAAITSAIDQLFLVHESANQVFVDWASTNELSLVIDAESTDANRGTFNAARIAAAWPMNSIDLTMSNLPQEFGRDRQAISFTKGCYLGQETVARLDAMGHVNQRLVVVQTTATPEYLAGTEIFADDNTEKAVGKITSAARKSPTETICLAMIRVSALQRESRLRMNTGESIEVVSPIS